MTNKDTRQLEGICVRCDERPSVPHDEVCAECEAEIEREREEGDPDSELNHADRRAHNRMLDDAWNGRRGR